MYKWGQSRQRRAARRRRSARSGSIRPGAAIRRCSSSRSARHGARRARNPLTGQILPATYIGQIVPGTGYTCSRCITAQTPCTINGFVTQRDGNYLDSGAKGFIEPLPIQFDPRVGMAWAINPRTVIRVAGGSFHDSTRRHVAPAGRWQRGVSSTTGDLLHRPRHVSDRRAATVARAEYRRPDADRERSGRTTSASRRRFSARSGRTSSSTPRMSARGRST